MKCGTDRARMMMATINTRIYLAIFCFCLAATLAAAASKAKRAARVSPFDDLTLEEMISVQDYLYKQKDLNLAQPAHAKIIDSYIFMIEAIRPTKADALNYLDNNGPLPSRAARVILFRGDLKPEPAVQEFKVFPLPNPTKYEPLINPRWKQPISFRSRSPFSFPQLSQIQAYAQNELSKVKDLIFEASSGYTFGNCTDRCLGWLPGLPPYSQMNHHQLILYLIKEMPGKYLHPIGLQFVVNMDETDDSKWTVGNVWFQGQYYRGFDHLAEEKTLGKVNIKVVPDPEGFKTQDLSSSLNFRGHARPQEVLRGPKQYMPDGNRFKVNGRRVSWLGWEFEFAMASSTGIELFDVKFLNERIAYELSLQEIGVFYSGKSPVPQHTTYYDSFVNMGIQVSELFIGIDCPKNAVFFDVVHFFHVNPHTFKNGVCVFEHDTGLPLRRHYEMNDKDNTGQGMQGNVLIFRQVLTVYNYDYIIDFIFHQAGQIEGRVSLTGYLLTTFSSGKDMEGYGHVVNTPTTIANIHHHVLHLKADLDIKGTNNRFETLDIALEEDDDPLNPGYKIYNRKFTRHLRETELNAAYQYNFDTPKYLLVSNEGSKNKFNYAKGYRILSEGMSKLLLPKEYRGHRSRSWTNYQVAVTKHNENERKSSTMYSTMAPYDPVMSFEDFIKDDERIVDQDLVAWISMGAHHIPHSEDVPIVTTPGVQLRFYLLPYNYFDEDPSLASRDNVKVTRNEDGSLNYTYVGFTDDGGKTGPVKNAANRLSLLTIYMGVLITCVLFL